LIKSRTKYVAVAAALTYGVMPTSEEDGPNNTSWARLPPPPPRLLLLDDDDDDDDEDDDEDDDDVEDDDDDDDCFGLVVVL